MFREFSKQNVAYLVINQLASSKLGSLIELQLYKVMINHIGSIYKPKIIFSKTI